jgi:hypothetical protein
MFYVPLFFFADRSHHQSKDMFYVPLFFFADRSHHQSKGMFYVPLFFFADRSHHQSNVLQCMQIAASPFVVEPGSSNLVIEICCTTGVHGGGFECGQITLIQSR